MASSGELLERRLTEGPKAFIERLRKVKFKIGTRATNMLAPDLHRTIQQLSVELYQNDFHFIKEIVQNAEDNTYAEDVNPSLEFQLIEEDLAEVGASATLVVLNNELGLTTEDVLALCSVGRSTKIGRRKEGLIGCKGIGFKSVFMICETPTIISNGYRIRFRAAPTEEAGVGYIVPEWSEAPSNEKIKFAIGRDELTTTVIILPIEDTKVELVRKQLKELSPEIILFLARIRELNVMDKTKHAEDSIDTLRITRSNPISAIQSDLCKFYELTLSVESPKDTVPAIFPYLIFQQDYPVTHPVQERKEIGEWTVTLAFPREGRPSSSQVGDVFSFLPTELRTGFPFIVSADFLLTTSRETIRFDSPWNIGILECLPAAFELAFKIMLNSKSVVPSQDITLTFEAVSHWDWKDAYRYLPHNTVSDAYRFSSDSAKEVRQVRQKLSVEPQQGANLRQLDMVRTNIFQRLEKKPLVGLCNLSVSNRKRVYYKSAKHCLQILSSFRDILEKAAESRHPSPSAVSILSDGSRNPRNGFAIVDDQVQKNHASGLAALGVPEMSASQYMSFLKDSEWLLGLPEKLYLQILTFFAFELPIPEGSVVSRELMTSPCRYLKIRDEEGKVKLGSFSELKKSDLIYTCSAKDADWIYAWAKEFEPWYSARVLPTETAQALKDASNSKELLMWINKQGSLTELNALTYAEKLIQKLLVPITRHKRVDRLFALLVLQCLYSGICQGLLSSKEVMKTLQSRGHVNGVNAASITHRVSLKLKDRGSVLLPRRISKWPLLFSISGGNFQHVTELSHQYLEPQCLLVQDIVTSSCGPGSMLEFIQNVFHAVDIPYVTLPAHQDFPFHHPVTLEKSLLLFQWLAVFLPSRRTTISEREDDRFLMSLKNLQWVKTRHHGWQSPRSVFFPISRFANHFNTHDLPVLDVHAYSLDVTDSKTRVVLEELGVVTDMSKGGAAVAQYFFSRIANDLNQEMVTKFYKFLNEVEWDVDVDVVIKARVWTPACGESFRPMWRTPSECVTCDKHGIFEDCDDVIVLDHYDASLLPFFSQKLQVSENALVDTYCDLWSKWSMARFISKEEPISLIKVQFVWERIVENWNQCGEDAWEEFLTVAWVPVAPLSDDDFEGKIISIVPPGGALIADDLALSKSFSEVADGNLNFTWLLPGLSGKEVECLIALYSEIGTLKLSEVVTRDIRIPPHAWEKRVPRGKGLICEGLFQTVLAYLSKKEVPFKLRKEILSRLNSATEIVVSEPFQLQMDLDVETLISPATVTKQVNYHYDKVTGELYHLTKDHAILKRDAAQKTFNGKLMTLLCLGILSEYPKLVPGLTILLKRVCGFGFALEYVEYELHSQNLSISEEDEKLLMEINATEYPTGPVTYSA